jgi:Asp-tRNA(Asn)/Glu-tRNA(Gln) amidotransferase A subunit family amidase
MSIRVAMAVALPLALSSCVTPAGDANGYQNKVSHSAQAMSGIVGSATLAARLDLDGRMISTVTDTVVSQSEQDAESVVAALDSVQPPDARSIELRTRADDILQATSNRLSDLRIAIRRNDKRSVRDVLGQLDQSVHDLTSLGASS